MATQVANAQEVVDAFWVSANGGAWDDGGNWSSNPQYPDNTQKTQYNAFIDLAGDPYEVSLASDIGVDNLTLDSVAATLRHTGGTFDIAGSADIEAGVYRLAGGTIRGGIVNVTGGAFELAEGVDNRMDGVTFNGDLTFENRARLYVSNGLTLNGQVFMNDRGNSIRFEGSQSFDKAVVNFDHSSSVSYSYLSIREKEVLTLGPALKIRGGHGGLYGDGTIINRGTVCADTAGREFEITVDDFVNEGRLEAINGGRLTLDAFGTGSWVNAAQGEITAVDSILTLGRQWTNLGTITAVNSEVRLDGTFATADIGTFNRQGGTVTLQGELDNTASELTFDSASGSWHMARGVITGGTIRYADGARILFDRGSNLRNELHNVTIAGDFDITGSDGGVYFEGDVEFLGDIKLGGECFIAFNFDKTLDNRTLFVDGPDNDSQIIVGEEKTLILGPGMVVRGGGARIGQSSWPNVMKNEGLVVANLEGSELEFTSRSFINAGVIEAIDGGTARIRRESQFEMDWHNRAEGLMRARTGGTIGVFTTQDQQVTGRNDGVLLAEGATLSLAGSWENFGTINILNGSFDLGANNSHQQWENAGTFKATSSTLDLDKPNAESGLNTGVMRFVDSFAEFRTPWRNDGLVQILGSSVLSIDPAYAENLAGFTLTGGRWEVRDEAALEFLTTVILRNQADVVLGEDSVFAALNPLESNLGALTLVGGRDFDTARSLENEGELSLSENSHLFVRGNFTHTQQAELAVHLGGEDAFSRIEVLNRAALAGVLDVALLGGYAPALGDSFAVLTADTLLGTFDKHRLPVLPDGRKFEVTYGSDRVTLTVVPEPGTAVLLAFAAVGLARRCR